MTRAWLIAIVVAGCGGGKHAETTPAPAEAAAADHTGGDGEMVPPEKMDEINRSLERKRTIMSHCLAVAVDNKELPKNSRGKVTVEIVIAPSGKPESVKVVRATLESKSLDDCVVNNVYKIQFPELPRSYETSFTYGFEAM